MCLDVIDKEATLPVEAEAWKVFGVVNGELRGLYYDPDGEFFSSPRDGCGYRGGIVYKSPPGKIRALPKGEIYDSGFHSFIHEADAHEADAKDYAGSSPRKHVVKRVRISGIHTRGREFHRQIYVASQMEILDETVEQREVEQP